ncbi:unnamed protein product [Caenorhabditis auriculariae]|uniref:Mannose-P-dolichol utilization defect 1 protein homolog n=1 Tax=Caenorhabditis auriculariae TaxID=2777116 RepID=A0A8S1GZY6_9PELO|nr:unnamed protein product [Caenorhabditis auriculariae]
MSVKTKGLTDQLYGVVSSIFPGDCFEQLVLQHNFFHPTCGKAVLSRFLGLAITVGSVLLFVPQILKIYSAKSAKGISLISQLLALVGAASTAAYSYRSNFVFPQWGDTLFVSIQVVIIILQILYYQGAFFSSAIFLAFVSSSVYAVVNGLVPMEALTGLQAAGIPIVFISKTLQCLQNYREKSTGQLSLISVFLQFAGTLARVFTSVQDTGDQLLIISYGSAAVLNGLIFAQFFIYWNSTNAKKKFN